jgi:hypothetical protein
MFPGCGLWSIIGCLSLSLKIMRDPDVFPLLDLEYPNIVSNRSNSSKVKSEGNVRNRSINLSFVLILQILRKGNYFLVTIQIFLQKNVFFLHFYLFAPSITQQPCRMAGLSSMFALRARGWGYL